MNDKLLNTNLCLSNDIDILISNNENFLVNKLEMKTNKLNTDVYYSITDNENCVITEKLDYIYNTYNNTFVSDIVFGNDCVQIIN